MNSAVKDDTLGPLLQEALVKAGLPQFVQHVHGRQFIFGFIKEPIRPGLPTMPEIISGTILSTELRGVQGLRLYVSCRAFLGHPLTCLVHSEDGWYACDHLETKTVHKGDLRLL